MMKPGEIKKRLALMEKKGCYQLLGDALQLHSTLQSIVCSPQYYRNVIQSLKNEYKKSLGKEKIIAATMDLEVLIKICKEEEQAKNIKL